MAGANDSGLGVKAGRHAFERDIDPQLLTGQVGATPITPYRNRASRADGILKRVVASPEGKEMILRFAKEDDMDTSYAAWKLRTPAPYSIRAVTKAQVAEMRRKRADLQEKLRQLMVSERERRH